MAPSTICLVIVGISLVLFMIPKVPILFTSIFATMALYFTGVSSANVAFSGFNSSATWFLIGMSMVSSAFFATGLSDVVGGGLFKLTGGNQKRVSVVMYVVAAVLSLFMSCLTVMIMFAPMIDAMVAKSEGKLNRKMTYMPAAIGALLGGNLTLSGSTNLLSTSAMVEEYTGQAFTFFSPFAGGIAALILGLVFYLTFGYNLQKKVFGEDDPNWMNVHGLSAAGGFDTSAKMTSKMKITAVVMVITIVMLVMNKWNMGAVCFTAAAVLLATKTVSAKEMIAGVPWNVVIYVACLIGFASGINASGAGAVMGGWVTSLGNMFGMGPFGMMVLHMLLCQILSNFMSNNAAVVILVPIGMNIATLVGGDPFVFGLATVIAINSAFVTPVSSPMMSVTLQADFKFTDYVKGNLLANILTFAATALVMYVLYF